MKIILARTSPRRHELLKSVVEDFEIASPHFDEDSVKALIAWAKSTSFPQSVTLSDAENIVDVKRFVQANLSDIDAHYPDDFYNPAITRLYRLKEYMEENK